MSYTLIGKRFVIKNGNLYAHNGIPIWVKRLDQAELFNYAEEAENFFPFIAKDSSIIPITITLREGYSLEERVMPELLFSELQEQNKLRCNTSYGHHTIDSWSKCDWMTALCGEVGELANFIKKDRRGDDIPLEAMTKELADIVI